MMNPLKDYRLRRGLTQTQIAELLGCSQSYIAHVESGFRVVSSKVAIDWEERTGGELSRSDLRPDLWPETAQPNSGVG